MSLKGSYDVIVIGAGPAGLSSALYLARSKAKFLVLEKGAPGGKLLTIPRLENYPGFVDGSGAALASNFYQGATSMGAEIAYGDVLSVSKKDDGFLVDTDDGSYEAKFLICATGLMSITPPIKNEKKFLGHGVSSCATCDGHFYKGKKIVVTGTGDRSIQEVLYLAGLASELTYLVPSSELSGREDNIARLAKYDNVHIIYEAQPLGLIGEDYPTALEYQKGNEVFSESGDGFFIIPIEGGKASYLEGLDLEKVGSFYKVDLSSGESSLKNLFIAGDLAYGNMKQVVSAASLGALAANSIIKRL